MMATSNSLPPTSRPTAPSATAAPSSRTASAWQPFRYRAFRVLWVAALLSSIGTWMHDVGAGWLMTTLTPSPLMVAMVQAATTLPVFLLALPSGALADIVDRRRLLVIAITAMSLLAGGMGLIVLAGQMTATALLALTFAAGIGTALVNPAWQAIVPQLVPREAFASAIALNSVGINISRAIGPALGGAVIVGLGLAWPFLLNAMSYLIVIGALLWWRQPPRPAQPLPAERLVAAMRAGVRYARASRPFKATLARALAFLLFASAYWALLPLIARQQLAGGAELYGLLVTCIGGGAVSGALLLPRLRQRYSPGHLVAASTVATAVALVSFAVARVPAIAFLAAALAGAAWITAVSSLNVSAQMSLPDWVRGRGLAVFSALFFGVLALGSALWGHIASLVGIPFALTIAAGGAMLALPVSLRFPLQTSGELDLTPSAHWPQPTLADAVALDRGPVMVTVEYRVQTARADDFLVALQPLAQARRRDGAFTWGVVQDSADPTRFVEYFFEASWLEHLRHHQRVTQSDRLLQERVRRFHTGPEAPRVTHFLAAAPSADPGGSASTKRGERP